MLLKPALLNLFGINLQTPHRGPHVPRVSGEFASSDPFHNKSVQLDDHDATAFRALVNGLQESGERLRLEPKLPLHLPWTMLFPQRAGSHDEFARAYPSLGRGKREEGERHWQLVSAYPELRGYASLGFNQVRHGRPDGTAVQIRHRGPANPIHVWTSYGSGANEILHQGELDAAGRSVFNGLGVRIKHDMVDRLLNPTFAGLELYEQNISPSLLFALWSLWQIIPPDSALYEELFADGLVFRPDGHPETKPWRVPADDLLRFLQSGKITNDIQFQIESARTVTLDDTYSHRTRPVFSLRQAPLLPAPDELTRHQQQSTSYTRQRAHLAAVFGLAAVAARIPDKAAWTRQQIEAHSGIEPPPLLPQRRLLIHYYQTAESRFPPQLIALAQRVRALMDTPEPVDSLAAEDPVPVLTAAEKKTLH